MQVSDIHNAQIGFALFDAWISAVHARQHHGHHDPKIASPLIDAAFKAFDAYAKTVETMNQAQIAAVGNQIIGYSAQGQSATPVTTQDIAPFLALNVMA